MKSFDVIGALTRTFPEWAELVGNSYFAASSQQESLISKWAKGGYEIFDWSTGVGRERSMAEIEAKLKGFDPYDIHEINISNYTLWFGKKVGDTSKEMYEAIDWWENELDGEQRKKLLEGKTWSGSVEERNERLLEMFRKEMSRPAKERIKKKQGLDKWIVPLVLVGVGALFIKTVRDRFV